MGFLCLRICVHKVAFPFVGTEACPGRDCKAADVMERRKNCSGQVTHVPGRKSLCQACVVDSDLVQQMILIWPKNVIVHGLRHTYVTHYYIKHKNDPDFDPASFCRTIGHPSIRTTMEIYAYLDMTQNRVLQQPLEDLKDF